MTDQDRLAQLRTLLDRLERMPASPDRDWMLAEVRSRAVDIDTGIAPRPMRPLESGMTLEPQAVAPKPAVKVAPPAPAPAPARAPAKPAQRRVQPRTMPAPAPVAASPAWEVTFPPPTSHDDRVDLLSLGGLLNLGDEPPPTETPADGEAPANRPWAGGLRG